MALPGEELRKRIVAAAALQGLGMRDLRVALADYGANATLAEQMVRGEQPQNDRNIRDLAETLGVPPAWFEAEDWRVLIVDAPPTGTALADRARERAARALDQGRRQSREEHLATRRRKEAG